MADITYYNYTNPTSRTEVTYYTSRNGAEVTISAEVSVTLLQSNGFIEYNGEISFNMWSGVNNASATIKGYTDYWHTYDPRTRTRYCSMTFTTLDSSVDVGCNITVPVGRSAIVMPDQYVTVGLPGFVSPTAPTWISPSPNPIDIDGSPLITWGGASVGSLNRLYYDLEVRSTKQSGGRTNWIRIATSTSSTSYQAGKIRNTNIEGQTPYVGVKYQYRVRSYDGSYRYSGWTTSSDLSVNFGNPTPPTSIVFSDSTIKKNTSVKISWSGATGGTGNITGYQLQYQYYDHTTQLWGSWTSLYSGSNTSYNFSLPTTTPNANGDRFRFRVRVQNSWGQNSSYYTSTGYIAIRKNQVWIKVNGQWVQGECYIKVNGQWVTGMPYIKTNGQWKEST